MRQPAAVKRLRQKPDRWCEGRVSRKSCPERVPPRWNVGRSPEPECRRDACPLIGNHRRHRALASTGRRGGTPSGVRYPRHGDMALVVFTQGSAPQASCRDGAKRSSGSSCQRLPANGKTAPVQAEPETPSRPGWAASGRPRSACSPSAPHRPFRAAIRGWSTRSPAHGAARRSFRPYAGASG